MSDKTPLLSDHVSIYTSTTLSSPSSSSSSSFSHGGSFQQSGNGNGASTAKPDARTVLVASGASNEVYPVPPTAAAVSSRALKRIPVTFTFSDISYEITQYKSNLLRVIGKGQPTTKRILDNVYGMVKPGETLAIMGPSGSGKTTLLDVLADRKYTGTVSGNILLNGSPRNRLFKRLSGYVLQQDVLIGHLTVREVLTFAAELRLDSYMPAAERYQRVQEIIDELKLSKVADSLIGTAENRGLSGGERKRVSIGVELITNPSLLFLDEFTTGLDSKTALTLMETLKELAVNGQRSIIFTIHQPRSNIFKQFDKLLLLADGKQIFFGQGPDALPFFESNGFLCDIQTNPSDFFLDIIADNGSATQVLTSAYTTTPQCVQTKHELRQWDLAASALQTSLNGGRRKQQQQQQQQQLGAGRFPENLTNDDVDDTDDEEADAEMDNRARAFSYTNSIDSKRIPRYAAPFHRQMFALIRREVLSNIRNPQVYWAQLFQAVAFGLIMGSLWSNNNVNADQGNTSVMFFVCSYLSMMTFMAAPHLISFRHIFFHERSSGSYRVSAFIIAKTIVDIPFYASIAVAFAGIVFHFAAMPGATFGFYILTCVMLVFTASSVITFIGSIAPMVEVAMVLSTLVNGLSMVSCGFLVSRPNLPSYWVWLYESSYIHHAFAGLYLNLFGEDSMQAQFLFGDDQPINRWESIWVLPIIAFAFRFLTYVSLLRKN